MKTPLDISSPTADFDEFLKLEGNDRIVFSGIFGIGKTYFLKEFFKKHPKYIALHLYPTNYSVSKNEDIFELIKYDLLYELLRQEPELKTVSATHFDALYFLQPQEIYALIKTFIENIPTIGKPTLKIIQPLEELAKTLIKKKSELSSNDAKDITIFADKLHMAKGSIYENDFYTELLIKLINSVKCKISENQEETSERKVVLVVDDLDRIDPEHIFRILNIFAVHFDETLFEETQNKFNLDKVIVACDIENIRKIFKNKYGTDVDFNGYVDKFYSREVYFFDNKEVLTRWLEGFINSIKLPGKKRLKMQSSTYQYFFNLVLFSMIHSNVINLRTLKSWFEKEIKFERRICVLGDIALGMDQLTIFEGFELLSRFFNGPRNMLQAIKQTTFAPVTRVREAIRPLGDLVCLADYRSHGFIPDNLYTYQSDGFIYPYYVRGHYDGYHDKGQTYSASIDQAKYNKNSGTSLQSEDGKIVFQKLIIAACENYVEGLSLKE
jgi:hypothetical protein